MADTFPFALIAIGIPWVGRSLDYALLGELKLPVRGYFFIFYFFPSKFLKNQIKMIQKRNKKTLACNVPSI